RNLAQLSLDLAYQLQLGETLPPLLTRLEVHEEFPVKITRRFRTVLRAAELTHSVRHLRVFEEHTSHLIDELRGIAVGNGIGHGSPDPEVPLFQLGHKFAPNIGQGGKRRTQREHSHHDGQGWVRQCTTQKRRIHPPDTTYYEGLFCLMSSFEHQRCHNR